MIVTTYMRRVRAIVNPHTGRLAFQRWHIESDGTMGWHGIPDPRD